MTCKVCKDEDPKENVKELQGVLPVEVGEFPCTVDRDWVRVSFREKFEYTPFVIALSFEEIEYRIDTSKVFEMIDISKYIPELRLPKFELPSPPYIEPPRIDLPSSVWDLKSLINEIKNTFFTGEAVSECEEAKKDYDNLGDLIAAIARCYQWLKCKKLGPILRELCINIYKVFEWFNFNVVAFSADKIYAITANQLKKLGEYTRDQIYNNWYYVFGNPTIYRYLDYCHDEVLKTKPATLHEYRRLLSDCVRRVTGFDIGLVPLYYYSVKYLIEKSTNEYVLKCSEKVRDYAKEVSNLIVNYLTRFIKLFILSVPIGYNFSTAAIRNVSTAGFEVFCKSRNTKIMYLAIGVKSGIPHVTQVVYRDIWEELRRLFEELFKIRF